MASLSMLTQPVADPRAWRAETVDDRGRWYHSLPDEFLSALRAYLARHLAERNATEGVPYSQDGVTKLQLDDHTRQEWAEYLAPALSDLEQRRGFVILDRLPLETLSQRDAIAYYWLIGQVLGEPFAQNVEGTLLYDVRDTGKDVASGARFSVTNYESSFHTDNSFGDSILDYVGLLCLKTAKSGGVSQNVSGYAVHDLLLRECPDVLQVLYQPLHVDRRGGYREGESPTVQRPVIAANGGELIVRYLRYWIEVGQEKAGEPLTVEQRLALDVLDSMLTRPELRVEFSLEPGQMYFINNRWILHNRTAFVDDPQPERRRHLVRLWLRARG